MANIELVIKIPEDEYNIAKYGQYGNVNIDTARKAIANGTPLPKGHGRLIDADALDIAHGVFVPKVEGSVFGCPADAVFADEINDAPTIIEADKAESEEGK